MRMHDEGILNFDDVTVQRTSGGQIKGDFTCGLCKDIFKAVQFFLRLSWTEDAIADAVGELCTVFKIEDETVCKGVARSFKVGKIWCVY